ncbi:hypothetical protein APSETT445_008529 [Aspergillus pseudonomiae]
MPYDVTLIFPDDNWGNVQRLPTEKERQRSGGIGLYYHFDYVGRPKSWKWQNNNNLPKVYKELSQAYERGADRVWVINVGDIKPMEIPLSFALDLAWNTSRFDFDTIPLYLKALATRDLGDKYSEQIASALMEYSHLAGLRKFEMLELTTYSILNFREAEQVLDQWRKLATKTQEIQQSLPSERHNACYHLLTYPATAGFNYYQTILGQGKNRQYSFERRNSANMVAGEEHLEVSIDWPAVPTNFTETIQLHVEWEPSPPYFDLIHIPIRNHRVQTNFTGFPESGGFVSMEGPHSQPSSSDTVSFKHIPYLGSRARSGSIALRLYMQARESEEDAKSAWVEYDFYLFNSTKSFNATVYVNGALDTDPNLPMEFSLAIDGQEANFTRLPAEPEEAGDTPPGWTEAVADHVWTRDIEIAALEQGPHILNWAVNSPEVYLEKIILALEGQLDSYLGPPESALVG